jgi:hypothetical protein
MLVTSSLFAGIKTYDKLEDVPSSAELYMMVDGGSFIDVTSLEPSYKTRFVKNPDAFVKVTKENGQWVMPSVQAKINKDFVLAEEVVEIEVPEEDEKLSPIPELEQTIATESTNTTTPKIKNPLEAKQEKIIAHFKNNVNKDLNKILSQIKDMRSMAILEGSLEKVKHSEKLASITKTTFDFSKMELDSTLKTLIASFDKNYAQHNTDFKKQLEDLKVAYVKKDMIPKAEEVDKLIKSDSRKMFFTKPSKPKAEPVATTVSANNIVASSNNIQTPNIPFLINRPKGAYGPMRPGAYPTRTNYPPRPAVYGMLQRRKNLIEGQLRSLPLNDPRRPELEIMLQQVNEGLKGR